MTLLELILALGVMSGVVALAATLWAQAKSWNDDAAAHLRWLRVARVTEMLQRQWSDRRSAVSLGKNNEKVTVKPDRLSFVSASPMLHTGWPLVEAAIVVRPDAAPGIGGSSAGYTLWYEESRISRLGATTAFDESQLTNPATQDEEPRRIELMTGVRGLRFERFGRAPRDSDRAGALSPARTGRIENDEDEPGARGSADDRTLRWREFDEVYKGPVPAVRLVGEKDGKEFACVFVIELSR